MGERMGEKERKKAALSSERPKNLENWNGKPTEKCRRNWTQ